MKRIVILGVENSHAETYVRLIRQARPFSELEIAGVYSEDKGAAARISEQYQVRMMSEFDEAVGAVDGVIVCARRGDLHAPYAKPYIQSGTVMMIDKPITQSERDATELLRMLCEKKVKVMGGSVLRRDPTVQMLKKKRMEDGGRASGLVCAPIIKESPYGGFFFYAQHLVDVACEIFGGNPRSVTAEECGEQIRVDLRYGDATCLGIYTERAVEKRFYAEIATEDGILGDTIAQEGLEGLLCEELLEFCELLRGGTPRRSPEDVIAPVFVLNAILRALKERREQRICYGGRYEQ